MKKLALALIILGLVAAGCDTNSAQPSPQIQSNEQPSQDLPAKEPDSPLNLPPTSAPIIPVTTPKLNSTPSPSPTPKPSPAPALSCDSNYSGCVPIASDVDCAGGSGDGPAYVKGPITVIGTDKYRLDSDHDGVACE